MGATADQFINKKKINIMNSEIDLKEINKPRKPMNPYNLIQITNNSGSNAKWDDRIKRGIIVFRGPEFKGMVVDGPAYRLFTDSMRYPVMRYSVIATNSDRYAWTTGCWTFSELFDELTALGYTFYQL